MVKIASAHISGGLQPIMPVNMTAGLPERTATKRQTQAFCAASYQPRSPCGCSVPLLSRRAIVQRWPDGMRNSMLCPVLTLIVCETPGAVGLGRCGGLGTTISAGGNAASAGCSAVGQKPVLAVVFAGSVLVGVVAGVTVASGCCAAPFGMVPELEVTPQPLSSANVAIRATSATPGTKTRPPSRIWLPFTQWYPGCPVCPVSYFPLHALHCGGTDEYAHQPFNDSSIGHRNRRFQHDDISVRRVS